MDENIKTKTSINEYEYKQYLESYQDFCNVEVESQSQKTAQEEYEKFKNKLAVFKTVNTISEAKSLAKKMFHIENEFNYVKAGCGFCTIISRADSFKIILSLENEVNCYSFCVKKEKTNEY